MSESNAGGAAKGPRLRTDIVDAYVFRRVPVRSAVPPGAVVGPSPAGQRTLEFLQLKRSKPPLRGSWQPVMGHVEAGETAVACVWRELSEEVGLVRGDRAIVQAFALEQVHPFFLAERDAIVLSPRFAVEVREGWEPTLNHEHEAWRFVREDRVRADFAWPGQWAACAEIAEWLLPGRDDVRAVLGV